MAAEIDAQEQVYPGNAICVACKGECCKKSAGGYHPDDFELLTVDSLAARFATGQYAIDWWDGDPRDGQEEGEGELDRALYVRPAHAEEHGLYQPSWGGTCVHLAVGGCRLPLHERPKGCCDLEPCLKGECSGEYGKRAAAIAWLPHRQLIEDAAVKSVGDDEKMLVCIKMYCG